MLRKDDLLKQLNKRTVNSILKWLFFCNRVNNDWHRLNHQKKCELIASRFDVETLNFLYEEAEQNKNKEIDDQILAAKVGLPHKIKMLENLSVADLDRIMEKYTKNVKKKLKEEKIQLLHSKMTREEIAIECGFKKDKNKKKSTKKVKNKQTLKSLTNVSINFTNDNTNKASIYDAFRELPVICKIRKYIIRDIAMLNEIGFDDDFKNVMQEFQFLEPQKNINIGFPVSPVTGTSGTLRKNFVNSLEHAVTILSYTGCGGGWTEDMWASFLMWYFSEPRAFLHTRLETVAQSS